MKTFKKKLEEKNIDLIVLTVLFLLAIAVMLLTCVSLYGNYALTETSPELTIINIILSIVLLLSVISLGKIISLSASIYGLKHTNVDEYRTCPHCGKVKVKKLIAMQLKPDNPLLYSNFDTEMLVCSNCEHTIEIRSTK